jgi:ribose 5-phosphate isomerase B
MKIAIGSDEKTLLTDFVVEELKKKGHEVLFFGPLSSDNREKDWPDISSKAAKAVASGQAQEGVIFCWTGTGASIAANKVSGIRAALCSDAETARGARTWNHANILVLSLRTTSLPLAQEILKAWFSTPYSNDEWNIQQIRRVAELDKNRT